jgi:serine/threonine protein kinase
MIDFDTMVLYQVELLSRLRHPNLITLIGANPESMSLVYEYLPNQNLKHHLSNKHQLPWQGRISIGADLCSALVLLHSSQPHSIVHGDVNPANIIMDANFVAKLSDFGTCRVLSKYKDSTQYWKTDLIKGTPLYMDPEFIQSFELTTKSDVYAFGVVLLQLLIGRVHSGIIKEVKFAADTGKLASILDRVAGDWPFVQAEQLARLGLQCCEKDRKSRPNIHSVGRILNAMRASFR